PGPTHQTSQPGTKSGVEPLDVSGVDLLLFREQGQQLIECSLHKTLLCSGDPPLLIDFDHLSNHDIRPGEQANTSSLARIQRCPKRLLPGVDITAQTVCQKQQRTKPG